MNKFITKRNDLLNIFTKATNGDEEDVEPVLDSALNNFKREMKAPLEAFQEGVPQPMKAEIFNILLKHFTVSLMNSDTFMQNKNISEIRDRIDELVS